MKLLMPEFSGDYKYFLGGEHSLLLSLAISLISPYLYLHRLLITKYFKYTKSHFSCCIFPTFIIFCSLKREKINYSRLQWQLQCFHNNSFSIEMSPETFLQMFFLPQPLFLLANFSFSLRYVLILFSLLHLFPFSYRTLLKYLELLHLTLVKENGINVSFGFIHSKKNLACHYN